MQEDIEVCLPDLEHWPSVEVGDSLAGTPTANDSPSKDGQKRADDRREPEAGFSVSDVLKSADRVNPQFSPHLSRARLKFRSL